MLLAIVPAAPPTRKNQRTTSCPAPISANDPYRRGSRLTAKALRSVFGRSCDMVDVSRSHASTERGWMDMPWRTRGFVLRLGIGRRMRRSRDRARGVGIGGRDAAVAGVRGGIM